MTVLDDNILEFLGLFFKSPFSYEKASEDASFRKYYRISSDNQQFILMVAPPEKESINQFLFLADELKIRGVNVPKIFMKDIPKGLIIMEDFGKKSLLDFLYNLDKQSMKDIYKTLINSIFHMQNNALDVDIPLYSNQILHQELCLFHDWYLKDVEYNSEQIHTIYTFLINRALAQRQVFVHRDFHCRNVLAKSVSDLGIIDFQDALIGPVSYDLVSILKDAYIKLEPEFILDQCINFWQLLRSKSQVSDDFSEFFVDFELMGAQRHLKILGIFTRLSLRDGKHQYLNDIPLVEEYLIDVSKRYPQLSYIEQLILSKRNKG